MKILNFVVFSFVLFIAHEASSSGFGSFDKNKPEIKMTCMDNFEGSTFEVFKSGNKIFMNDKKGEKGAVIKEADEKGKRYIFPNPFYTKQIFMVDFKNKKHYWDMEKKKSFQCF